MNRLKYLRESVKLSQSELAKKSGLPLRTIQEYEQGRRKLSGISIERAKPLSDALSVNIEDLLEEK